MGLFLIHLPSSGSKARSQNPMENGNEQEEVKQEDEDTVYTTPEQILAENETPASSSDEANEQVETEAAETAEAEPEAAEDAAQPEQPVVPEPKPVPGETPR